MAHGIRLKDESTGAVISFLRNSATSPRTYSLPDRDIDFGSRFVTPEDYGAVGDGATNDQAAIQNAVNSGFPVFFGRKNYRVNSGIAVPDNAKLIGSGGNSIISTVANTTILAVQGSNTTIDNLTLVGNDTGASQYGITFVGIAALTTARNNNMVSNCRLVDLNTGMLIRYTNITTSLHYGSVKIINTIAFSCPTGFLLDTRAEYTNFSNCCAMACGTGLIINSGNTNWVGGQLTDNTTGVSLTNGTNDGHGVLSGVLINHNTTNISGTSIANNFTFADCMIYSGNVTLTTCDGIKFNNCEFGTVTTFTVTNCTATEIMNCKFETTPTFSITGTIPKFFNNKWQAATTYNDSGNSVLVGGTVTVSSPLIKSTSIILVTSQVQGGTPGWLQISARVAATSFTILSSSGTDTSTVGWQIIDP